MKSDNMKKGLILLIIVSFVGIIVPFSVQAETYNAGTITISHSAGGDIVLCSPNNHYNIDVGNSGATVYIQVYYTMYCSGSADDGNCDISFVGGGDSDSAYTGGSLSGYLTISKFMSPDESFSIKLHAKYTDWYGTEIVGEDTEYAYGSTLPKNPEPIAAFTFSPLTPTTDDTIQFTDQSSDSEGGTISSWYWSFGDGATSTNQNPTHKYSNSGTFTATLQVTDNQGLTDSYHQPITVKHKPIANFIFSPSKPTINDSILFTDQSTDPDGSIVNWTWSFGDGTTSTTKSPTHQYKVKGNFSVILQVKDSDGYIGTKTKSIILKTKPIADFSYSPESPKPGDTIQYTDISYDPDGSIVSWLWNFGDQTSVSNQNPAHKYTNAGTYSVQLQVTDNDGFKASKITSITVKINQLPIPNFSYLPLTPTTDNTIQFNDNSNDPDGTITSWSWNFGDDATSSVKNPTHQYQNTGTYTIILQVIDNDGGSQSKTESISVITNIQPRANFSYSSSTPKVNETMQFTDKSDDPDGTITLWNWNFGDGTTSTMKNPTHTYSKDGTYQVTLQVTDNNGATHIKINTIVMAKTPGFELIFTFCAIVFVLYLGRQFKKKKRKE